MNTIPCRCRFQKTFFSHQQNAICINFIPKSDIQLCTISNCSAVNYNHQKSMRQHQLGAQKHTQANLVRQIYSIGLGILVKSKVRKNIIHLLVTINKRKRRTRTSFDGCLKSILSAFEILKNGIIKWQLYSHSLLIEVLSNQLLCAGKSKSALCILGKLALQFAIATQTE